MTVQARNFRSHYYERMGFRGVEEKKSLDKLLSERPVDLTRIQNFCLRLAVPAINRPQVWKLVLGILPIHSNNVDFVWRQRVEQWRELKATLEVTKKITPSTSPAEACCIVWLLETRQLNFNVANQLEEKRSKNFIAIARALSEIFESDEEVYWVCKGLFKFLETSLSDIRSISECFSKLIKEDLVLYNHLDKIGALSLPFYSLIGSGLAGRFSPVLLEKLWDKVIGGSVKVLVYVLVAALSRSRQMVLASETCQEIERILDEMMMNEERAEAALTSGLDLWVEDGCPLGEQHRQPSGGEGASWGDRELMAPLATPIRRPSLEDERRGSVYLEDELRPTDKAKLDNRRSDELSTVTPLVMD